MTSTNTIVCVRHGETTWKREGRTQGQLDSPLTDVGIRQVRELASELQSEGFGFILSSPLGRALQTTEILLQQLDISDWRSSDHIAERYEGVFQGLTRTQQVEQFPQCFDKDSGQLDLDLIPQIEPTSHFLDRVRMGLRKISQHAKTTPVLVVTHTGILQALIALVSGKDYLRECTQRSFGFCEILRLDRAKIEPS